MGTIFKLIIEDDEGKTTVYPLADTEVSIGRKEGNTIRLLERNVSRRHARLSKTNGAVYIEDLDSYNGVKINGERIAGRYEVKEGDLVEIGDYHLALQRTEVIEPIARPEESSVGREVPPPPDGERWRHQGTVPDFRLPKDALTDSEGSPRKEPQDTVVDQPLVEASDAVPIPVIQGTAVARESSVIKPPPLGSSDDAPATPQASPASVTPLFQEGPDSEDRIHEMPSGLTVGPATHSKVPRLVCVSTGYAGREYALTRPELVVGRVEDNDIVIEHRSVSRNHAKIVYDGRTHKIIDLQSANGILVNGEEYAMTDLRRGDLIELGHVRFRFVPAQDPFYPTSEEAKAMEDAGIEPPPLADAAGESVANESPTSDAAVAAYDPSTAATVTDTPLDEIGIGHVIPSDLTPAPGVADTLDTPASQIPGLSDDRRSTDVNAFGDREASTDLLEERGAGGMRDAASPPMFEPPRRNLLPLVVIGLALVAVVLLGMLLLGDPGEEKIRKLRAYAEAGRHTEVISFFVEHKSDLEDSAEAWQLFDAARAAGTVVADEPRATAPVPDEPVAESVKLPPPPEPPEEEGVEQKVNVAPRPRPRPTPAAKKPKSSRRRGPTRRQRAKERYDTAFAHLMFNRTQKAINELDACLRVDERFADCHRLLGSTWAEQQDSARAVKHYRRYLQLAPNARDASQIRAWIESYESDR